MSRDYIKLSAKTADTLRKSIYRGGTITASLVPQHCLFCKCLPSQFDLFKPHGDGLRKFGDQSYIVSICRKCAGKDLDDLSNRIEIRLFELVKREQN